MEVSKEKKGVEISKWHNNLYFRYIFLHRSLAIDHPAVVAPDGLEQDELLDDTTDVFTPIVPVEDDVDEIWT